MGMPSFDVIYSVLKSPSLDNAESYLATKLISNDLGPNAFLKKEFLLSSKVSWLIRTPPIPLQDRSNRGLPG
jgi:hypothetical protein